MATLSDLKTTMARALRDPSNATWDTNELGDLINQGIDELAAFYPKEIVQNIGTIATGVRSYAVSDFLAVYRIDIFQSDGTTLRYTLPHSIGEPDSGWEQHGRVIYFPPSLVFTNGDIVRAWGYGGYIQLSADSSTTDLDTSGINAIKEFIKSEAFDALIADRSSFQQWQANSNASDVTMLQLAQAAGRARQKWLDEQRRLRRLRKL